jgi:erythromycin esterase-like protein
MVPRPAAAREASCLRVLRAFLWLFIVSAACSTEALAAPVASAVAQAAKAVCGKQLVLIGEADHGDGATVEFKAALVQRLILTCGFDAVYFEAGTYDFLKLEEMVRERKRVDAATLSSAISALWNRDEEIAPLVRFLLPRVNSSAVGVGGIDDQIGSVGAFYSLDQMPADLAAVLPEPRRSDCREQMQRRANYHYSDEHPHDAASIADLDRCLAEVEQRLRSRRADLLTRDRLQMAAEFRHAITGDFLSVEQLIPRRDRRMYHDLRWLMARAGTHRKTIVWTANDHAAKAPDVNPVYAKGANMGTLVHQVFGSRAFALGISAAGGSHYWGRKEPSRPIPQAVPDSVEARALEGHDRDAIYVSDAQLKKFGMVAGSFSLHQPHSAHWYEVFDGVVILRAERPPVTIP